MMKKILLTTAASFAVLALANVANAADEAHGPLHFSPSSAPNADGFRQKVWAMAPDLDGPRMYVYRNGSGEELFTDTDNGTTNDEFDVFCPGAPGSGGEGARMIPEANFGPGTVELWQNGQRLVSVPVTMCGPTIGVPASNIVPTIQPVTLKAPTNDVAPPLAPPAVRPLTGSPDLRAGKGGKWLNSTTVRWRIVVKNKGTIPATNVKVVDQLPSGVYVRRLPAGAKLTRDGKITMTVNVPAGGRKVIGMRIRLAKPRQRCMTNRFSVTHGDTITGKRKVCKPKPRVTKSTKRTVAVVG